MIKKRYCIICGKEIQSDYPDEVFCPEHGGASKIDATTTRPQETTWEAEEEVVQPIKDIAASWQPGQTLLDTYKVVGKLGEGGMGLVYLVHHKSWNMDLAVKQPKATLFATQKGKEDFIREAETWVDLGLHPHITSCYYVRVIDDIPHIFVEFMEGKSLEHWIQRKDYDLYAGGPEESLERILDIAIQFAWGLAYAHEQGLVHQDVKPLNVLMTPEGIMKVTDFGLAKARAKAGETVGGKDTRALVNGSLHTVEYRSPEQAKGEMLSHKTDIWSWGVSVLEMFEGGVFWLDGQSAGISLESYLGHEGENHLPSMPDGLIELLQACFQKDPVRRPENILIIAKGLIETYERNIGKPYQRQRPEPAELKADSLNNKALTMLDLGHEDIAIQNWTEALEEDPAHGEANLNYQAYLWWKAEITDDKMLANLTQISGTNMASPTFWKGMAELHGERGDWKEQGECLKKAIQLCPTLPIPEEKNLILQKSVLKGHSQQVFSLQLNPGQDILASAGSDGSIRLWDIKVGRCLKILKNAGFTTSLAFSPDGGELVSGSSDKTVKVWNLSKGRLVKQLKGHTDVVTSVAFSNDGQYIISGSLDGTARVWKRSNGRCIQEYKEHQHWILSIQIPAEGDLALTASRDQTVHLWQIQTGETVRVYERPRSPRKAEYGRGCLNAGKILWAGYDSMCLWDYGSGRLITQFISCQEKGAIDPYMSGDLSPVGTYAVTVGQNGEKRFWETSSGRCISTIPSPNSAGSVIFGPDDKLFCAVGKDIEVWQVKLDPDRHFYHYALSIPANSIIALEKQSQLKDHLEQAKGYQDQRQPEKAIQILRSLQKEPEFKHDEKILNQLADCAMLGQKAGLRECWMHSSYHLDKPEGIGGVTAVRFNSTATMLAAGHRDGSVHCFDLNTRKKERELQRHIGKVEAFVFLSPESLLSLSRNGDLILWNIPLGDGKVVKTRLDPNEGAHLTVLLAEDGQYLVVQGLKGYSRIPIHLERLEMLPERPFKPLVIRANLDLRMPAMMKDTLTGFVYQSAVSPDGTLFTSTMGDSRYGRSAHPVFVWEITPGGIKSFRRFIGHTHPVLTMTFSKDQTELITADIGGEIRIWDLPGDACKRTFKQPSSQFTAIDCSPDGNFIIAGDSKGKLFLWDHDGKALLNIKPHRGKINSVTFSDNGRFAASGGFDNQIQVWEFDWDYQFPRPTDWNEGARPYAEIFLTRHQPLDPITKIPRGRPVWKSKDLEQLIRALSFAGFGWLREDGVHRKLEELSGRRK